MIKSRSIIVLSFVTLTTFYWVLQFSTENSSMPLFKAHHTNGMETFEKLMSERKSMINKHCSAKNLTQKTNARNLYVLKSKSLVYCPVYKAATTKWLHNLLFLAGKTQKEVEELQKNPERAANLQGRLVAPAIDLKDIKEVINPNSTSFIIVR